jgi:hypothetical protein
MKVSHAAGQARPGINPGKASVRWNRATASTFDEIRMFRAEYSH